MLCRAGQPRAASRSWAARARVMPSRFSADQPAQRRPGRRRARPARPAWRRPARGWPAAAGRTARRSTRRWRACASSTLQQRVVVASRRTARSSCGSCARPKPMPDRGDGLVGQAVLGDRLAPGVGLGLGRGHGRPGRERRARGRSRCCRARARPRSRRAPTTPAVASAGQQRPAHLGVDGQALERRAARRAAPAGTPCPPAPARSRRTRSPAAAGRRCPARRSRPARAAVGRRRRRPRRGAAGRRRGAPSPAAGTGASAAGWSRSRPAGSEHQLDEVAAGHLGVAGHVPRGAEDQRARQAVVEAARVGHGRGERALVEADLGVGEVVVVDQQQVRLRAGRPARAPRCARRRRRARAGRCAPAGRPARCRGRRRAGAGAASGSPRPRSG